MQKHAYLIMAHNDYKKLNKLIEALDDIRNDIYIHIDKRDKDFNIDIIIKPKFSEIIFIERMKLWWGGFSITECELKLLKEAKKKQYDYYHLLSGADFPLKSNNYIHDFFRKNHGKEFLGFNFKWNKNKAKKIYIFTNIGRDFTLNFIYKTIINNIFILIQKCIKYSKKYDKELFKGATWFSITHDLTEYILSKETFIRNNFTNYLISDEMFIQTIVANSHFKNNVYKGMYEDEYENNMRYIDWSSGNMKDLKIDDFKDLIKSDKIFARKIVGEEGEVLLNKLIEYRKEQ
jgi:hypothetical protein